MARTSRLNWHRAVQARIARSKLSKSAEAASNLRSPRFEILENRLLLANDFGDAPAPYPTTLIEDGPAHESFGPTLGGLRDTESDGTHSPTANFDGPDDDGVAFGPVRVGQLGATVEVVVQNAPTARGSTPGSISTATATGAVRASRYSTT